MVLHNDAADEDTLKSKAVTPIYKFPGCRYYKKGIFVEHATCNWYRYAKMRETTIGELQVFIIDKFGNLQKQAFWAFDWSATLERFNYSLPSVEAFAVSCGLVLSTYKTSLKLASELTRCLGFRPYFLQSILACFVSSLQIRIWCPYF